MKYSIKTKTSEIEPQEVFLDSLAEKRQQRARERERKLETPLSSQILSGFWFLSVLLLSLFFLKTFQLSFLENEKFVLLAQRNFSRLTPLRADRGVVYDRNLKKLVSNSPSFDLILDKRDLPSSESQKTEALLALAKILKKDLAEMTREIQSRAEDSILIAENLDQETIINLETKTPDWPWLRMEKNTVRNYSSGPVFSQVLGFVGRINADEFKSLKNAGYFFSDYLGKQGLEKTYEKILRGRPGFFEIQKDASGRKIQEGIIQEPLAGQSLVLWLDADLQEKLFTELSRVATEVNSPKAAAVALDPKTGGVLALVSLPTFDNNLFGQAANKTWLERIFKNPGQPLFNRAVSGNYASGSTIKPLVALAALEERVITGSKQIFDAGFIEVRNQYDPDVVYVFHGLKPHGWVDLREAIAVSSNIYFYTVGGGYQNQPGLGSGRIKKYLEIFNWGKLTGIDLPQETRGLIPDHKWKEKNIGESWYVGDTYNLAIGQGYLQVSPLQVVTAFAALANQGTIFKPQLVKEIVGSKSFEPEVLGRLAADPKNLEIVRQGMRDAVEYGSATTLQSLLVSSAAKTGTAQTPRANYYHNWATVFTPFENPEIVLTVMIEDVPGLRAAALPVAREVLKWYFER
jgi:penicillin-binding protein 2